MFCWSKRFLLSTSLISSVQSIFFFQEKWGQRNIAWVPNAFSCSHIQWEFGAPESWPDLQILRLESLFNLDSIRYLLIQLCCANLTLHIFLSVCCLCSSWWCCVLLRLFLSMNSTLFEEWVLAICGIILIPEYVFPLYFLPC